MAESTVHGPPSLTGQQLRQAREAAGLSRRDLANQIGATCTAVTEWEHGEASPSIAFRRRLWEVVADE